jgi:hypothetical protein
LYKENSRWLSASDAELILFDFAGLDASERLCRKDEDLKGGSGAVVHEPANDRAREKQVFISSAIAIIILLSPCVT